MRIQLCLQKMKKDANQAINAISPLVNYLLDNIIK